MTEALLTVYSIGVAASECRLVLAELQRQTVRDKIEVMVVTSDRSGLDPALCEGFARFSWLDIESLETSGEAMAAAIRSARTPFVVYAEEHQYLDPGWAEALIEAHQAGHDFVGFAMENANPGLVSWAHFYGQFGPSVSPVDSASVGMLTGHHVSYRRSALLEYGDLLASMMENECAMFLHRRASGQSLYMAGDAIVRHVNISRLSALMSIDFLGQRTFAASRATVGNWSWARRLLYAAAGPLIPWLRTGRAVAHIHRTGRTRELMPGILAPLLCMTAAGALGEMLGYLVDPGRSAEGRLSFEIERDQHLAPADTWSKDT